MERNWGLGNYLIAYFLNGNRINNCFLPNALFPADILSEQEKPAKWIHLLKKLFSSTMNVKPPENLGAHSDVVELNIFRTCHVSKVYSKMQ